VSDRRPPDEATLWDPGLQPERTSLSWLRTGLGMVGVSLLLLRESARVSGWLMALPLATAVIAASLTYARHGVHLRRVRDLRDGASVVGAAWIVATTAMVLALALLGLVISVVQAGRP
jgi:hypothetical protein